MYPQYPSVFDLFSSLLLVNGIFIYAMTSASNYKPDLV
jgi:hypothetical protein